MYPLFITRFSLSKKTAIGVQTARLLHPHPTWKHIYWERVDLQRDDPKSFGMEAPLPARLEIFKGSGLRATTLRKAVGSWWDHNRLNRSKAELITKQRAQVSAVYIAPIGGNDAARMRYIVQELERPFILHLWDMLDGVPAADEHLQYLVDHAARVRYLSRPMYKELVGREDATPLLFSRPTSLHRARPPSKGSRVRVVLLGNIAPYEDGVELLREAALSLESQGVRLQVTYVGSRAVVRRLRPDLAAFVNPVGFLQSDDALDRYLASCHIGYLPGPIAAPSSDYRSRFSIPSRILDFAATGLPIVGVTHPQSATAIFFEEHGMSNLPASMSAEALAESINQLRNEQAWHAASELMLRIINSVIQTDPSASLKSDLDSLSTLSSRRI